MLRTGWAAFAPEWGERALAPARAAHPDPVRAVRRAPARWRLGRVPPRAARHGQALAVGAGAHGDPRERASPPAGAPDAEPHPCRGARRTRRAVGDGGGRKMRRPLLRDRRDLGRPQEPRLHRDPAARGRVGAVGRALLAGSPRRPGEFERSANALAHRERTVAAQCVGRAGAGHSRLGRRAVPGEGNAARPLEHRA